MSGAKPAVTGTRTMLTSDGTPSGVAYSKPEEMITVQLPRTRAQSWTSSAGTSEVTVSLPPVHGFSECRTPACAHCIANRVSKPADACPTDSSPACTHDSVGSAGYDGGWTTPWKCSAGKIPLCRVKVVQGGGRAATKTEEPETRPSGTTSPTRTSHHKNTTICSGSLLWALYGAVESTK